MKNRRLNTEDYKIVEQVFASFAIRVAIEPKANHTSEPFNIFKNPDGSVRWLWPSGAREANFLQFYSVNTWKAYLFTMLVKLAFIFRLQRLIFERVDLYIHTNDLVSWEMMKFSQFTVFTGTPGKYRKAVCFHHEKEKPVFSKVALTGASLVALAKEYKGLLTWKKRIEGIHVPEILDYSNPSKITISSIKLAETRKIEAYSQDLLNYQLKLSEATEKATYLSNSTYYFDVQKLIPELHYLDQSKFPHGLKNKLINTFEGLNPSQKFQFTYSHGDFTPWNSYIIQDQFYLYDFEFSKTEAPLYYDIIHFHFQKEILVNHNFNGFNICKKIAAFLNEEPREVVYKYIELYLLYQVSYSLLMYQEQEVWHTQVTWLLKAWDDALTEVTPQPQDIRQSLVSDVLDRIFYTKHSLLKSIDENPYELNIKSDLDILIDKRDANDILEYFKTHPFVESTNIRRKSFMTSIDCFTINGGFLSIDLLFELKRKELILASSNNILDNSRKTPYGIHVPDIVNDFKYIFSFYILNEKDVPEKYITYFKSQKMDDKSKIIIEVLERYKFTTSKFEDLFTYSIETKNSVLKNLNKIYFNRSFHRLGNMVTYVMDTIRQFFNRSGIIITFSGVDGAGKSTVIDHVKHNLEKVYRKNVVVLRHRPSILPILSAWRYGKAKAEAISVAKLPRQGNNSNKLSSFARFLYYYMDYIVGQWVIYFKYLRRGYIVLYDRYYYDFINDARRSNIQLPESIVKSLYTFVSKPHYNFFLYADAEVITNRKKELSKPVIEELTHKYLNLFNQLSSKYRRSEFRAMENIQLESTLSGIMNTIKTKL